MKTKVPRVVLEWVPVVAWMGVIFVCSTDLMSAGNTSRFLVPFLLWLDPHISLETLALAQLIVRKAAHLTEYAILATLVWRAARHGLPVQRSFWKPATLALVVAMLYAASDEFHQSFIPSRTATEHDVLIDIIGALVGLAICRMLVRSEPAATAGAV